MNSNNKGFVVLLMSCLALLATAQTGFEYNRSEVRHLAPDATVNVRNIQQVWMPELKKIEVPVPGGSSYGAFLQELKKGIHKSGNQKQNTPPVNLGDAAAPILSAGFLGNSQGGNPNDNDVAIANSGVLISVINSNILFYDTQADTAMLEIGLQDFADTLGLTAHMYDPKVVFDPNRDRFVMVWLSGNETATSNIVLAFSTSNDPLDDWNLYYLPGDALDGATWTDFPMIALTNQELILTGNALIDDTIHTNDSWKYLFKESMIWQIDLQSGYNADTLSYRYYTGIYYNGKPIRNLCPAEGGSGTYGPNCYMLSNRNFDIINDTIFLLELTGTHNNPNTELLLELYFTDIPYGLAPDGMQRITTNDTAYMQTNDSRVLGAIYELGAINYVQNTVLTDSARGGVYHGYLNLSDGSNIIEGNIIGDYNLDFGYPNISYTGHYPYDSEFMITFLHTSSDTFPGISAVFYDANNGYSSRITIREGEGFLGGPGARTRWGDYTGSAQQYNEPGTVWMSGYYVKRGSGLSVSQNRTWIAKLQSPDTTVIIGVEETVADKPEVSTYPNPAPERVTVSFTVPATQLVQIDLYDNSGRLVKTFIREALNAGDHTFGINTEPLSSGVYHLQVSGNGEVWTTKKILKP